jgi:hypothetical protein
MLISTQQTIRKHQDPSLRKCRSLWPEYVHCWMLATRTSPDETDELGLNISTASWSLYPRSHFLTKKTVHPMPPARSRLHRKVRHSRLIAQVTSNPVSIPPVSRWMIYLSICFCKVLDGHQEVLRIFNLFLVVPLISRPLTDVPLFIVNISSYSSTSLNGG